MHVQVERFNHAQGYSQYKLLGLKGVAELYNGWRIDAWVKVDDDTVQMRIGGRGGQEGGREAACVIPTSSGGGTGRRRRGWRGRKHEGEGGLASSTFCSRASPGTHHALCPDRPALDCTAQVQSPAAAAAAKPRVEVGHAWAGDAAAGSPSPGVDVASLGLPRVRRTGGGQRYLPPRKGRHDAPFKDVP